MVSIKIVEQNGKFGLIVEGEVDSGEREHVIETWESYDLPVYKTVRRWALEPKYDNLTNVTIPGYLLHFYIAILDGQSGLYYIDDSYSRDPKPPEFVAVDFSHDYHSGGPDPQTVTGGFIIAPQPGPLVLQPDEEKHLFLVTLAGKHGILSWRGYRGRKPIYDEIAAISGDVWVLEARSALRANDDRGVSG
jgi:hypothetical protein